MNFDHLGDSIKALGVTGGQDEEIKYLWERFRGSNLTTSMPMTAMMWNIKSKS